MLCSAVLVTLLKGTIFREVPVFTLWILTSLTGFQPYRQYFPALPRAFVYTIPVAWRVVPLFTFRKGMTNGLSGKLVASWSLE